jgi:hypothetical protein
VLPERLPANANYSRDNPGFFTPTYLSLINNMPHIVSLILSHMAQKGRFYRLQDFPLALLS